MAVFEDLYGNLWDLLQLNCDALRERSMANPNNSRRVTLSLAIFVLICFFLPWVQLSCAGIEDSASGFDLARATEFFGWSQSS